MIRRQQRSFRSVPAGSRAAPSGRLTPDSDGCHSPPAVGRTRGRPPGPATPPRAARARPTGLQSSHDEGPGEILQAALSLPAGARAAIAGSLLDSLDTDVDEAADEEWRAEIRKRLAQLDGGRVTRVSWSEVRARLEQQTRP